MESQYRNGGVIETQAGFFSLEAPVFEIETIAHALSNNCRYNGHCANFYSVAEHSVLVSRLMETLDLGDPMEGLLHDATEAYLSDVPSPFKEYLPDWKAVDAKLDNALRAHFGLGPKTAGLKTADWIALFIEAYHLLPSRGEGKAWIDPERLRTRAIVLMSSHPQFGYVAGYQPSVAKEFFLRRYNQLRARRDNQAA